MPSEGGSRNQQAEHGESDSLACPYIDKARVLVIFDAAGSGSSTMIIVSQWCRDEKNQYQRGLSATREQARRPERWAFRALSSERFLQVAALVLAHVEVGFYVIDMVDHQVAGPVEVVVFDGGDDLLVFLVAAA